MLEVSNVKVYDLKESVIACRNAMRTEPPQYTQEEFEKSLERAKKLVQASKNSSTVKCHDNFLTGIRVSFDVKYPQYWTPEFQRYHFADIVTSSSKMHRLLKMDISRSCNKYVTPETKRNLMKYIDEYNILANEPINSSINATQEQFLQEHDQKVYEAWMKVLSNCPLGLELFERISTNYKQLQTIYWQRKNHKLKEDWGAFCKFIEDLPYSDYFIMGKK